METITEHYNNLKEPYKTEALNNIEDIMKEVKVNNLLEALYKGFNWRMSKEGFKYWGMVYDLVEANNSNVVG